MIKAFVILACLLLVSGARLPDDAHLVLPIDAGILSAKSHIVDVAGPGRPTLRHSVDPYDPNVATVFDEDANVGALSASKFLPEAKDAAFDPKRAQELAQLQSIAYCTNLTDIQAWNCTRCAAIPDFQTFLAYFDERWDLLGYIGYWPSMNAKVLVFRGTDSGSWYNWAENMRAWRTDTTWPVPGAPPALRVHSGFLILYNSSSVAVTFRQAFNDLLEQHPDGPTYVLGHSMGGALAHFAALDLKFNFFLTDVKVYTFGAPRVGNSVFADFFQEHITESWRFTHGRDIVPSVPLQLMGFHHVSREIWLVDVADPADPSGVSQRVVVCDDTGEDPSCHNSVCHLGLCTSVADHLVYYGAHMYRGDGEC